MTDTIYIMGILIGWLVTFWVIVSYLKDELEHDYEYGLVAIIAFLAGCVWPMMIIGLVGCVVGKLIKKYGKKPQ